MKEKKSRNTNLQITLVLFYILLATIIYFLLDSKKNHDQQQHLQLITKRYQLAYNTIYVQYEQFATNVQSGMIARFGIIDVYQKLLTADEKQKEQLKKELFAKIKPRFNKLHQEGKVQQFHFHLKDNESFLRIHQPETSGDNLTGIGKTVEYVNKKHSPIAGFETGKTYCSYRFIFPLTADDQTHLGSMEISFGPEIITSSLMKQYLVLSNFFIKEEPIKGKAGTGKQSKLYKPSHHKGYLFDLNVLAALKNTSLEGMKELKPQQDTTDAIFANAHSGQAMSIYDQTIDMVFTTLPIFHPVTQEMAAFLTIRSQSDLFKHELQGFRVISTLSLLLLAMFFTIIYVQHSKRKTLEDMNIKQLQLAANVLENIAEGVVVTDIDSHIIAVNKAVREITGYREKEVLGQNPRLWKSQHHDNAFYQAMWSSLTETLHWHGEIWNRRKNGDVYPSQMTITGLKDEHGQLANYVSVFSDISSAKESQEKLQYLAQYDQLTNLPNRRLLNDRLNQALSLSVRRDQPLGLLLLDLDDFKAVNDTLGHKSGDILLIQVAERLLNCVRKTDTVSRLGGDEFVVLLPDCKSADNVTTITRNILEELVIPFDIQGDEVFVSASIGVTMFPDDGDNADTLFQNADTAMYDVKGAEKNNFQFFTASMQEHIVKHLQLTAQLRYALEREEFILYYQPKMNLATGSINGMEALIRWQHPDEGMVNPADFIPLAEETGIIIPLGKWILYQACKQAKQWQLEGLDSLRLSVNLSARQFQDEELVEMVENVIQETGMEAGLLELEITETTIMQNIERTIETLWQLRNLGVLLSIDDFGTGYSSLNYLKRFPLDILKIDRSFVMDITTDPNDRAVVEAIVSLSHHLKMKVVAEGVETEEQLNFLRKQKCHEIQGYYLSKPLPVDEFREFIQKHRRIAKE